MLPSFAELYARCDQQQPRVPIAIAGGADLTVLESQIEAQRRGWVQPILVGDRRAIHELASTHQLDLSGLEIVEPTPSDATDAVRASEQTTPRTDDLSVARTAVQMVSEGRAALLVKGQIATPDLMRGVLDKATGLRTGATIGQIVLMELVDQRRQFLLTDTGITIEPTLPQKIDLAHALIRTAQKLGVSQPRLAVMSATEKVNPAMPDTLDAEKLTVMAQEGTFGSADVAGPLSFDLAFAADAGEKKKLSSSVIGQADAMLFPNLLSANLTVKAIMYTANCRFGGYLTGTKVPVVFMSRADTTETRLRSLAFSLQLAR